MKGSWWVLRDTLPLQLGEKGGADANPELPAVALMADTFPASLEQPFSCASEVILSPSSWLRLSIRGWGLQQNKTSGFKTAAMLYFKCFLLWGHMGLVFSLATVPVGYSFRVVIVVGFVSLDDGRRTCKKMILLSRKEVWFGLVLISKTVTQCVLLS